MFLSRGKVHPLNSPVKNVDTIRLQTSTGKTTYNGATNSSATSGGTGSVNLSSPESAYSTGYSTDGTSPGASFPPEYYINIRTGTHYFQNNKSAIRAKRPAEENPALLNTAGNERLEVRHAQNINAINEITKMTKDTKHQPSREMRTSTPFEVRYLYFLKKNLKNKSTVFQDMSQLFVHVEKHFVVNVLKKIHSAKNLEESGNKYFFFFQQKVSTTGSDVFYLFKSSNAEKILFSLFTRIASSFLSMSCCSWPLDVNGNVFRIKERRRVDT